jgi:hypothetical protein
VPREDDNDAMLLWRATVDPIDNVGEPYAAEWVYPEGRPSPSRFEIQQDVPRYMMLSYDNPEDELPAIGWWFPGQKDEYVYLPRNNGVYHDFIPNFYVRHSSVPLGRGLNMQYVSPVVHDLIPLGELTEEWINFLIQHLHGKGRKYVKKFIDRYILTTKPFSEIFTREKDRYLRNNIFEIFKEANKRR